MKTVDVELNRLAAGQYSLAHRNLTRRARHVVNSVQRQLVVACPA